MTNGTVSKHMNRRKFHDYYFGFVLNASLGGRNCGILNKNKIKIKTKANDPVELFLLC
jgi:hypothetical protein